jgi:hypothetical protein
MLKHYRTLTRKAGRELPHDLLLLDVRVAGKSSDDTHSEAWGRTEGVVLDDDRGEVVFFVVCVYPNGSPPRRVLVPIEAVEVDCPEGSHSVADAVLRVDWTPDQLHAQPNFTSDGRLPEARRTGGPPVTSRWMPARPIAVPPGSGTNWSSAKRYAAVWGGASAVVGALLGLVIGGLLIGATLAVFFGVGAAIAGFLVGASRESAADASEFDAVRPAVVPPEIERLERALHDVPLHDILDDTSIIPTAVPPRHRPAHPRPATATS